MFPRRRQKSSPVDPAALTQGPGVNGGRSRSPHDWPALLRRVERKRRALQRDANGRGDPAATPPPEDYYVRATWASFRLDGHDVTEAELRDALGPGSDRPALRSRQALRLRNHAAILHRVENDLQQGLTLTSDGVLRWYVAISAGLSTTSPDQATEARLEEVVRRVNSPQLRLQPALQEVAATHLRLLADPLVPSFNGILARLLLRYHLGRCKLPGVVWDPATDARPRDGDAMLRRLVELLDQSYDHLLRARP
jgi:hypothetical protein